MKTELHRSSVLSVGANETIDLRGEDLRCPICLSSKKKSELYRVDAYGIFICENCGTLHLSPRPNHEKLSQIYNANYYSDSQEEHGYKDYRADKLSQQRTYLRRLKLIKPLVSQDNSGGGLKIHEVGCALGYGLETASRLFSNAHISGSDISAEAVRECKQLSFSAEQTDAFGRCDNVGQLDLLYGFDFIEHLPSIKEFREWSHSVLKPRSALCLTTPNMNSWLNRLLGKRSPSIKVPQHTIYFTTETLQMALEPEFELVKSWVDYQLVPIKALKKRVYSILGLQYFGRPSSNELCVWAPNGMRVYFFRKKD